ncbi:helix-turn-helix domain-containing protein [Rhizobium glycinendophyticum]|uniref:Cyclic nucleotide-binding domain-containing protein n=1 Tax=Rhizobium glycinendophyticum TaxID=2589807 RepID=A0A504TNM4_9HYPH|nr:helix-turn-helix domain-containing protein [Rhizobium glycinendophyticum]TPP04248.1 cyclic nucleotide-binding domain-containing protein [Rhizobium glycinendophyticum]
MQTAASITMNSRISAPPRARNQAHIRPVTVHAPDCVIYAQGERARSLYQIEYGAVRIYRLLTDGRRQIVAFHLVGETFGFEISETHSFYAEAMVNSGLTSIERPAGGQLNDRLVGVALKAMVRAQEHLLVVGRQSSLEKIAVFLMDLADRQGSTDVIDLPMSRVDIGDYLGLTIETVSRTISKLRDMGILKLHNARSIEILKQERLRLMSN